MSASLGDSFPPEVQKEFKARTLKAGAVFRVFLSWTVPPKEKRIVIVGVNEGKALVGHLLLNTNLNLNCHNNDELRNLQIYIPCDCCDYLDHDSYLDCSELFEYPLDKLQSEFDKDSEVFLGHLSNNDFTKVIDKVTNARTITPKKKKIFGLIAAC